MIYETMGSGWDVATAIVNLAATGAKTGLSLYSQYQQLKQQEAMANSEIEIARLQAEMAKLEREAELALAQREAGKERGIEQVAKFLPLIGGALLATYALVAQ